MTTGTSSIVQARPDELADVLTADFQRRAEPQFAWKSCVSQFLALPGLRGFWPMSSVDYTAADQAKDLTGQGYHLTNNNTVTFGYEQLAPYANFVQSSSQYLSRADGGAGNWADILGSETYIVAAQRGLTFGGWFWFDSLPDGGASQGLICKYNTAGNQRAYILVIDGTNGVLCTVSGNGTNLFQSGTVTVATTGIWYFIVGRFIPSTEVKVWVNRDTATNVVSIPATINDSTDPFYIGYWPNATYLDGRASMCFLCAAALSDAIINQLYEQSRVAYGVLI